MEWKQLTAGLRRSASGGSGAAGMLKEGWLEAQTGTSAKGRPTRIYRLTNAGTHHLEREVVSFEKMFAGITRVLATAKV